MYLDLLDKKYFSSPRYSNDIHSKPLILIGTKAIQAILTHS